MPRPSTVPPEEASPPAAEPLDGPSGRFLNRELSLLEFNRRVLEMAEDRGVPLLERLRYLTISSSNLDEFFEVRVGGLHEQIVAGMTKASPDGLRPDEALAAITDFARTLVRDQYQVLNGSLLPALEAEGIRILRRSVWTAAQRRWVERYFREQVLPVLTPIGLDPSHPFPRILNKSLNFAVMLAGPDAFGRPSESAVVQAPRVLPRLITVPREVSGAPHDFILLSSVIHAHVGELFPGMKVKSCNQFRVTRNSDLWVDDEEVEDLLRALQGELVRRNFGEAVRLEVTTNSRREVIDFLLEQFGLGERELYVVDGPVNLNRLSRLYDLVDRPELKFRPFLPGRAATRDGDVFAAMRERDLVLHHPFESFTPVVDLVRQAASDPNVLAIKQTLYRTGKDSPLADALLEAARNGKEVTAVVELRARFDEAANIELATRLQELGAKVVYGVVGYKTHAKMLLVVRREGDELRRYVHLGTGNYHTTNTRLYTDVSLLTSDRVIGEDVHRVFQRLTGLGRALDLQKLVEAPFTLHDRLLRLIEDETEAARQGKPARVAAKMNALIEPQIIEALYRASQAGVTVDLIVRGICCLRPGVPGLSDRIRVRSIVGRFLEHARIFYFHAGGRELVYGSSADWMQRNFFGRVEVCFPIEDPTLARKVFDEGITTYLEDDVQAWDLGADGRYRRSTPGPDGPRSAQERLLTSLATPL